MMYQRIFVPVDSSTASNLALDEAIKLARGLGSKLVIAHAIDLPVYGRGNPEVLDSSSMEQPIVDAAKVLLGKAIDRAVAAGVEVESVLLENRGDTVADILLNAAYQAKVELIMMGTHGRTGIMHLLMGSVAEGVLRASDLPIMLVRSE